MQNKSTTTLIGDDLDVYQKGEIYFFVTYPGKSMFYPLIESYVYLGTNYSDEDIEDTWYFQPAEDFACFGSALEGKERPVSCAKREQLSEFQSIRQLVRTLEKASVDRMAVQKKTVKRK